ncbi:MAG: Tex family protein [Oscillospiraceae bacterium]
MDIIKKITEEFHLKQTQVENTVKLIDEDNTIPFIARYRKELTGSLDDQVLRELNDRLAYLRGLEKRKAEIITTIDSQGKLTEELTNSIHIATTLAEIEDIYRPYKQKRKTRASIARDRGLEPLATELLKQEDKLEPISFAESFINEEVPTAQDALNGAMDIIAETISDSADLRKKLRAFIIRTASLCSKASNKETETVYGMYYDFSEPVNRIAGHRILAIDRGEREDALKVSISINIEQATSMIINEFVSRNNAASDYIRLACVDSFSRLIFPSLEREIRTMLTENASKAAVKVFSVNLRQLLMQPPVKGSVTLGLDPAFRTGCKIAVVDDTGKVLDTTVIYPTAPHNKIKESGDIIKALIQKHNVTTISIGNGTASRESESFVASLLKEIDQEVSYMVVSEAGASVYSASKLAADEFPQFDVSIRSAVSIARRMQDPLAELVKIDPKSIGVGQYQHDMPKALLDEALGGVVESCVNQVGVDLNTASQPLLSRVAGINTTVAKNIVLYREENGAFKNRKELMKVAKLGAKAFTQCAGFLRVSGGDNVLDNTGVHPESYKTAQSLLKFVGYKPAEIKAGKLIDIKQRVEELGLSPICEELQVGEPTIRDIIDELAKPGRDPRDELPKPLLRSDVLDLKDLKTGMELIGTVRNVIDFGAFVDIGVHEDGLVHISQICDRYIKHPLEVLNVGDVVTVWVISVDIQKKRIGLTMKKPQEAKE